MTQEEVTIWELENFDSVIGWTIDYNYETQTKNITFNLNNKTKKLFENIPISNKINYE